MLTQGEIMKALEDFFERLKSGEELDVPTELDIFSDAELQELMSLNFPGQDIRLNRARLRYQRPKHVKLKPPEPEATRGRGVEGWMLEPTLWELERKPRPPLLPVKDPDLVSDSERRLQLRVEEEEIRQWRASARARHLLDTIFTGNRKRFRERYGLAILPTCPVCGEEKGRTCKKEGKPMLVPHSSRRKLVPSYVMGASSFSVTSKAIPEEVKMVLPVRGCLFLDKEIDGPFRHLDLSRYNRLDAHARRCAYWLSSVERARRYRAFVIMDARRKGIAKPLSYKSAKGSPKPERKEGVPKHPSPAGYYHSEIHVPYTSKDGCWNTRAVLHGDHFDRRGSRFFFNKTLEEGKDRRMEGGWD